MYPPEPEIVYGVFDNNYYAPIRPGHNDATLVGFGINNLPDNTYGTVTNVENETLREYLALARTTWEAQCRQIDFDAVENPFTLLLGLTLSHIWIYSDQIGFHVALESDDRQIHFDFGTNCMVTGLMTPDEITNHIYSHARHTKVEAVDGDIITLSTGARFAVTSRYKFDVRPTPVARPNVKAMFIRNLVTMSASQDSELEPA